MLIKTEGDSNLGKHLRQTMQVTDSLDMLVGFFYFSGLKVIAEPLRQKPELKLRVLVGMDADILAGQLVEMAGSSDCDNSDDAVRERYQHVVRKIMGSAKVDNQAFHERIELFAGLLESGRLAIRKTRQPNHAKPYIFHLDDTQISNEKRMKWITGSSNFSEPGLVSRDELNVSVNDYGQDEVQEYFDRLWNDAVPLTATDENRQALIKILRDRSVAATVTPYEAYLLILRQYLDYQKSTLNVERLNRLLKEAGFSPFQYQTDAVAMVLDRLKEFNGVILADVVGLGKSVIASAAAAMEGGRGLIICPPGLMGQESGAAGGWYEYKRRFGLHGWEVWSRGKLPALLEHLAVDPDFDLVIVDEAHNFRNPDTEDFCNLLNICFGKKVILLTATPFNNRPTDLLALLKLFTPNQANSFGNLDDLFYSYQNIYRGIGLLSRAIAHNDWSGVPKALKLCKISPLISGITSDFAVLQKECAKVSLALTQSIRQLVEKVFIRRNRLDLQGDPEYKAEINRLSCVCPPKEQFFELTDEQNEFYDRVLNSYFGEDGRFHGAVYRPQLYLRNQEGVDEAQTNIYLMLLRMLVQRFESSFYAFKCSIIRVRNSMEKCLTFIEKTGMFLYNRRDMEKILENCEDEGDIFGLIVYLEQKFEEKNAQLTISRRDAYRYSMTDPNFDGPRFQQDIEADITLMDEILEDMETLQLVENDPKAEALLKVITEVMDGTHKDIVAEPGNPKRKILLFSSYRDTILHVAKVVQTAYPDKVLQVDGANYTESLGRTVKENFDASFPTQKDTYDILLTTDKLSEGFNLNRAGLVINYDIPWNPTRVIQRVGRINRIGKKVFDNLYIFNFFPTQKGDDLVNKRVIAEGKMFAIHKILDEDAQIFSIDETPTASGLYNKLCSLDDGEGISFYTKMKQRYAKEKTFLQRKHPEVLERVEHFPSMVKTAWQAKDGQKNTAFMFMRKGSTLSLLGYDKENNTIDEWTMEAVLPEIECDFTEKRTDFSPEFWKFSNWKRGDKGPQGIYDALKRYQPQSITAKGKSVEYEAVNTIISYKPALPEDLQDFSAMVADDIQHYGTLAKKDLGRIAEYGQLQDSEKAVAGLKTFLERMLRQRGAAYLAPIKKRKIDKAILVTIDKCRAASTENAEGAASADK